MEPSHAAKFFIGLFVVGLVTLVYNAIADWDETVDWIIRLVFVAGVCSLLYGVGELTVYLTQLKVY